MNTPKLLILFRLVVAPIIISSAYFLGEDSKQIILSLMLLGLLSDIFDGIIARKQKYHPNHCEEWIVKLIWFFGYQLELLHGFFIQLLSKIMHFQFGLS